MLDFIGHQHADFRYDLRYRALTGTSRPALARAIAEGFPTLPAGCRIELDRVATDLVLDNVRSSLRINWQSLATELKRLGDCSLPEFLANAGVTLDDLYRRSRGGWTDLRRRAGTISLSLGRTTSDLDGRSAGCCISTTENGLSSSPRW